MRTRRNAEKEMLNNLESGGAAEQAARVFATLKLAKQGLETSAIDKKLEPRSARQSASSGSRKNGWLNVSGDKERVNERNGLTADYADKHGLKAETQRRKALARRSLTKESNHECTRINTNRRRKISHDYD